MRYVTGIFQIAIALTLLSSCTPKASTTSEIAPEIQGEGVGVSPSARMSAFDVNKYQVTKTVCDPFGDNPDPRSNQGLKAELYQLPSGKSRPGNVGAMISQGLKSDRSLFFSQLNVPTRLFNLGFANETGDTVKSDAGKTLIEDFALRFKSILKLAPGQKEGMYEFAILSDDGAIMNFRDADGVYRANVNNDGDHPTRLGCGGAPVAMNAETEIPMTLDYYQGPRYHISLLVLMREYKSDRSGNKNGKDPACGVTGNETWFNPDQSSKPQKAFNDLLARDWRVLTKDNYALANEAVFNPCKDGVMPVISGFQIFERFNDGFIVTWKTDIPATSQVVMTDPSGLQTVSVSDNILRTSHQVRTTGAMANMLYKVQAVSISETYGRTVTPPIEALTDY